MPPPRRQRGHGQRAAVQGGHGADVVVGDERGPDPHRVGVGLQPDEADARAGRRVGGDLVAQRAAVAGAVAEHQVDLGRLVEAQRDLVGEQVADVEHFLARVLQRGDDAVADRAALGGERGERGEGALAELAVGLVGGQERDLVDQDHDERVLGGRGVVALAAGEPGGPVLHRGHVGFEQVGDVGRVGGVPAVPVEQRPAEGQLHQLRITGMDPDQPGGHRGEHGPDQAPQVGALARSGRARDQQVRAVQPDRERPAVLAPADRQRPQVGHRGDRQGGDRPRRARRGGPAPGRPLPGPAGADPAREHAEPVRQLLGPVGERLGRLPGHQPDRHQVGARPARTLPSTGTDDLAPVRRGRARRWSAPRASAAGSTTTSATGTGPGPVTSRANQSGHTTRSTTSTPAALVDGGDDARPARLAARPAPAARPPRPAADGGR